MTAVDTGFQGHGQSQQTEDSFRCWMMRSCARPLIVDNGTALSAAADWRQPHAKSFPVLLNLEILPFKVSIALKAYSSNAANIPFERKMQGNSSFWAVKSCARLMALYWSTVCWIQGLFPFQSTQSQIEQLFFPQNASAACKKLHFTVWGSGCVLPSSTPSKLNHPRQRQRRGSLWKSFSLSRAQICQKRLGLGVAKPWWVRVSEVFASNFDCSKPNLARQKAPWLPLIQVSRDIDSRSRLKTAVCNRRFLSCAISRCYPSKTSSALKAHSMQRSMDLPRFRAVQDDTVKVLLGHVFVWKIGVKCTDIVLTLERNLIWTDFDSWILMKMNWNPACSDIFGQGQMPHLFWCWILQSCARPLIVDKGTALSAAAEWRQPHAKSFLVLLNLEILPFKVSKALKAYSSNAANIARKRERQRTKPKFAQKQGTNPRSRRMRQGERHAYHAPFCNMANHCHIWTSHSKSKLYQICGRNRQSLFGWYRFSCNHCYCSQQMSRLPGRPRPAEACDSECVLPKQLNRNHRKQLRQRFESPCKRFPVALVAAAGWRKLLVSGVQVLCILEILH